MVQDKCNDTIDISVDKLKRRYGRLQDKTTKPDQGVPRSAMYLSLENILHERTRDPRGRGVSCWLEMDGIVISNGQISNGFRRKLLFISCRRFQIGD